MTSSRAYATVTGPTAVFTTTDGHTEPLTAGTHEDIRLAVVRRATEEARRAGLPIELVTSGDRGDHHLLVHTDGTLTPMPATAPDDLPTPDLEDGQDAEVIELFGHETRPVTAPSQPIEPKLPEVPAAGAADHGVVGRGAATTARPTFLTAPREEKPTQGLWARLFGGGRSARLAEQEEDVAAVSRQWAGCRTIAVVNGKGGVGKTMTTGMLAAVYARHGGGNVLAWDNNDTRGTLGWRTDPGLYDTTVRDLHDNAAHLLQHATGVADIARYVHHQTGDRYDVLRSNPELLATHQRLTTADFDLLMQVAARFYRLVVFDSGNDESADRWLRMIDHSYQLVLPTLPTPESAESAALLLDELRQRDARSAQLADRAVVVITQHEPTRPGEIQRIVDGFEPRIRAIVTIPFDPALKSGGLRYDNLRPRTQQAWIHAAATTARGL